VVNKNLLLGVTFIVSKFKVHRIRIKKDLFYLSLVQRDFSIIKSPRPPLLHKRMGALRSFSLRVTYFRIERILTPGFRHTRCNSHRNPPDLVHFVAHRISGAISGPRSPHGLPIKWMRQLRGCQRYLRFCCISHFSRNYGIFMAITTTYLFLGLRSREFRGKFSRYSHPVHVPLSNLQGPYTEFP
jgi:hypothetical protein